VRWEGAEHHKRTVSGALFGVQGDGGEVVVEWEDAEHQKRAVSGAFLVFDGKGKEGGGSGGKVEGCRTPQTSGVFLVFDGKGRGGGGGGRVEGC